MRGDRREGQSFPQPTALKATGPCIWLDATYLKVRQDGPIASIAVIIATEVNGDGRREVSA